MVKDMGACINIYKITDYGLLEQVILCSYTLLLNLLMRNILFRFYTDDFYQPYLPLLSVHLGKTLTIGIKF